jgi:hypothetical protein
MTILADLLNYGTPTGHANPNFPPVSQFLGLTHIQTYLLGALVLKMGMGNPVVSHLSGKGPAEAVSTMWERSDGSITEIAALRRTCLPVLC